MKTHTDSSSTAPQGAGLQVPGQPGYLRSRILKESRESAKLQARKTRTPHFKAPPFPGASAYNSKTGFSELPRSGAKQPIPAPAVDKESDVAHAEFEVLEDAEHWSPDEHYDKVMLELDAIDRASRSNSPSQVSFLSGDNVNASSASSWDQDQSCQCQHQCLDGSFAGACHRCTVFQATYVANEVVAPVNFSAPYMATNDDVSDNTYGIASISDHVPFLKQPDPRPISEQQLIDEVKGIYAGLVMVEKKCVEIVTQQSQSPKRLENVQWKALVALHRTLLQEHHDFFSASQHPVASDALKQLAIRYAMPARMWRHGIHSILELFRYDRPQSDANVASFIRLAYTILEDLALEMPRLSHGWDAIKYNLREYLLALKNDGIDLPISLTDQWVEHYSPSTWNVREAFPPMSGNFFGDDTNIENYLGDGFFDNVDEDFLSTRSGVDDVVLRFQRGWLHYGRKIATSFSSFTQTFLFLGLLGSGATLLN